VALKEFIEKISIVEEQLDLSRLKVDGYNPWPCLRLLILDKYNRRKINAKKRSLFKKLIALLQWVKLFLRSFFLYISYSLDNTKVDVLFFTRQSDSQKVVNGELFNKYSASFNYFFSKKYKVKELEICDEKQIKGNRRDVIYYDFILKKTRIKCFLRQFESKVDLQLFDDINHIVQKEFGFKIAPEAVLRFIYALSLEFLKTLKKHNPKLVFLTVFYCPEAMAMCLACHRLGIQVVDYQHGAQNNHHPMYTHWNNIPRKGYELIPSFFWMWGEVSQKRIDMWAVSTIKHKAIVGGDLWLTYSRENDAGITGIEKCYKENKVNILISLQGDVFFPDFLLESMKSSAKGYIWHFRDHPRLPVSKALRKRLMAYPNAEFDYSSNVSLYPLLKYTDIHITAYSTVAFEAQNFNVPTIFIHNEALDCYAELLNKNGLYYVDSCESLNILLTKILSHQSHIEPHYIMCDSQQHDAALKALIGSI